MAKNSKRLEAIREKIGDRHGKGTAVIPGVGKGHQTRCREPGIDLLYIEGQLTVAVFEQIPGRQADIGSPRFRSEVDE